MYVIPVLLFVGIFKFLLKIPVRKGVIRAFAYFILLTTSLTWVYLISLYISGEEIYFPRTMVLVLGVLLFMVFPYILLWKKLSGSWWIVIIVCIFQKLIIYFEKYVIFAKSLARENFEINRCDICLMFLENLSILYLQSLLFAVVILAGSLWFSRGK